LDLAYFDSTLQAFASPCLTEKTKSLRVKNLSKSFEATDMYVNWESDLGELHFKKMHPRYWRTTWVQFGYLNQDKKKK